MPTTYTSETFRSAADIKHNCEQIGNMAQRLTDRGLCNALGYASARFMEFAVQADSRDSWPSPYEWLTRYEQWLREGVLQESH